jgi:putative transposase
MPRLPRPVADGLLYHVLNRGNNRAAVFGPPEDYLTFLQALTQTQSRYPFQLYAYCLMSNHFHLLLAPAVGQNISRIVQSLTVTHTWHYHKAYQTSGHVWQGRFKSPTIQNDAHALVVLRYIEANPLRAGLVSNLASYPWSSYRVHGMGMVDPLVQDLPVWLSLKRDGAARQVYWREWVHTPLTDRELSAIRQAVVSGRPYGSTSWAKRTAAVLGLPLSSRPRGRPRKEAAKVEK